MKNNTITQLTNKIMAERARQSAAGQPTIHQAIDTAPPPPYSDPDSDDDDSDDEAPEEPMKLVINANHTVHGSNNLVPTSPSTLADATKFSAILLNAVTQLNRAVTAANAQPRRLHVDLTINCGISVVGNRNVIGNIGLKPKAPTLTPNGFTAATVTDDAVMGGAESTVVVGAKRKSNDDDDDDDTASDEPQAKRLATR